MVPSAVLPGRAAEERMGWAGLQVASHVPDIAQTASWRGRKDIGTSLMSGFPHYI